MLRMSVMLEGLAPTSGPTDPYAMGMDGGLGGLLPPQTKTADGPARELHDRHVVLVVSPGSEPTRPHVAANLAAIYAEAGQRVVVVSTGEVEARLKGSSRVSVNGDISTEDVEAQLQPSRLEHVSRLPLSPFISRSGELVTRGPAILDAARALSDVIIVEVPPLLAVHHAEALVHSVDVVLVVAECRVTTFDQARRAGDLLRRMGAPVLGVVLTNVRIERADIRHSALTPPSVTETETAGGEEAVLALSAGGGSTSGSTTRTQA
jgi:Mrp family chromosome partitioning ATPase